MLKTTRAKRVLDALAQMNVSQMLIIDPLSIKYLTEVVNHPFERFYGLLLSTDRAPILFANRLFNIPENLDIEVVWHTDTDNPVDTVIPYIDPTKVLGVDKDMQARHLLPLMDAKAACGFQNTSIAVDTIRGIKDAEEQEKMRTASLINDAAIGRFKELIHEGVTEREVADQTLKIYLDLGADGFSFEPLIAFGANAADPHHSPDDTVIKPGDCVLFDVGCIKDGYCSDMTRTFYFKEVSKEHERVYNTVRTANEKAIEQIRAGVELHVMDDTARGIITDAGYGPYFTHRLGHFIGLNEHEFGDVSSSNMTKAVPGMIFSIEPGIYLTGDTGVRVEDLVMVTEDGVEVLNHYPKALQIIEG